MLQGIDLLIQPSSGFIYQVNAQMKSKSRLTGNQIYTSLTAMRVDF